MCLIFVLFYLTFITVCKLAEAIMRKVHLENLQNGDCRYKSENAPLQTSARPSRKDKFAQANIRGPCLPHRRGRVMSSTSRPNNGRETEQAAIRIRCPPTAPAFPTRNAADCRIRCPPTPTTGPAQNVTPASDTTLSRPIAGYKNVADYPIRCPSTPTTVPAQNVTPASDTTLSRPIAGYKDVADPGFGFPPPQPTTPREFYVGPAMFVVWRQQAPSVARCPPAASCAGNSTWARRGYRCERTAATSVLRDGIEVHIPAPTAPPIRSRCCGGS
eukprot:XP_016656535.1 PREDICTED: uncharacterized protein LOC107882548 [Acyrthosiphon pisum]